MNDKTNVSMSRAGFARFRSRGVGYCPGCGMDMFGIVFPDTEYVKEFEISGFCPTCQDDVFSEEATRWEESQ